MSDKEQYFSGLSTSVEPVKLGSPSRCKRTKALAVGFCLGLLVIGGFVLRSIAPGFAVSKPHHDPGVLCPQVKPITPTKHSAIWESFVERTATDEYKTRAIEWLGGAVRIPTESYDNMDPVGVDPRWEVFGPFHDYLLHAFPLVHSSLSLTKVNTWGLVYVWPGSDESLRPVLFTAHQDVVPVNPETVSEWKYPPYSGYYDGKRIWGRGSADYKNGIIGVLAAVEELISGGFKPTRGVVLAFGFDEEASGVYGAGEISKYLLSTFGGQAFAIIVDEGAGFRESFGSVVALPAVTEKGHIDVHLSVASPGGHSSIPPEHTSIGYLAAFISQIEDNPIAPKLSRSNVYYDTLICTAAHSAEVDRRVRKTILASIKSDKALRTVQSMVSQDPLMSALVRTTRAVDIVGGGVKSNALPEDAWAVINHRIATESSVAEVMSIDTELIRPLAAKFNLSFTAFGEVITDPSAPSSGSVALSDPWGTQLNPAPSSSYKDSVAFDILSGTIKSVYNIHRGLRGNDNIKVYPTYTSGNTDTRYYWKLSENIYRYNHWNGMEREGPLGGIHTINENLAVDNLLEMIEFFAALILNADEASHLY